VVTRGAIDTVIVGFHRTFDFEVMTRASTAVRNGARLVGTNDDSTYPTPEGLIPGGGAILASIAVASGVSPIVAGKPHRPMADLVHEILGGDALGAVMVGDRPDTDGLFASQLGCRYAQVWSGVTRQQARIDPVPDLTSHDLAGIATQLLHR
jgi:4-nitrophenyl phosphatase